MAGYITGNQSPISVLTHQASSNLSFSLQNSRVGRLMMDVICRISEIRCVKSIQNIPAKVMYYLDPFIIEIQGIYAEIMNIFFRQGNFTFTIPYSSPALSPISNNLSPSNVNVKAYSENIEPNNNPIHYPLPLKNIGNSCYLDSILQLLFINPSFRQLLNAVNVDNRTHPYQFLLVNNLRDLMNESIPTILENDQLQFSFKSETLRSLRKTIFESHLHCDLDPNRMFSQYDAEVVLDVLLESVFDMSFKLNTLFQSNIRTEDFRQLRVSIIENLSTLEGLVQRTFTPFEKEYRREGKIELLQNRYTLTDYPDFLPIHLMRFSAGDNIVQKISNPVELPKDGKISFQPDIEKDERIQYEMTGYVTHTGGFSGGHYVAYVKDQNTYWCCNDSASLPFVKMTPEEFYSNKNAYIVLLKKMQGEFVN